MLTELFLLYSDMLDALMIFLSMHSELYKRSPCHHIFI